MLQDRHQEQRAKAQPLQPHLRGFSIAIRERAQFPHHPAQSPVHRCSSYWMQMSITNPWSDKLNKGNSEQFEKFPGKNTTPCQIYKLQSKQQFERKAKIALISLEPFRKSCRAWRGKLHCKIHAPKYLLDINDHCLVKRFEKQRLWEQSANCIAAAASVNILSAF